MHMQVQREGGGISILCLTSALEGDGGLGVA